MTGRWVVVAPSRSHRPLDEEGAERGGTDPEEGADRDPRGPARDPSCPFCPGNEDRLPDIIEEMPAEGGPGWRCRAVPNRYAAFGAETGPATAAESRVLREDPEAGGSVGRGYPAIGRQEVLIESPRHDREPASMSANEMESMVELYHRRLRAVTRADPEHAPSLFRNRGRSAGASLLHPHAQLVATREAGPRRRIREERLGRYHAETGQCLLCRLVELEPQGAVRIVEEDALHQAYVPWAPERPLEVWIVPRRHRASFTDVEPDELESLARMLRRTLRRIRTLTDPPDYNYMLHTSVGARREDPGLHWFLQIRPVTARMAGFELGTGMIINPESPAENARRLREVPDDLLRLEAR